MPEQLWPHSKIANTNRYNKNNGSSSNSTAAVLAFYREVQPVFSAPTSHLYRPLAPTSHGPHLVEPCPTSWQFGKLPNFRHHGHLHRSLGHANSFFLVILLFLSILVLDAALSSSGQRIKQPPIRTATCPPRYQPHQQFRNRQGNMFTQH